MLNLVNYDPEDTDTHSPVPRNLRAQTQDSSTHQSPQTRSPKSPRKPMAARKHASRNPYPLSTLAPSTSPPPRPVTPAMAIGAYDSAPISSTGFPLDPLQPSPTSDLSPAERKMVMLAIQERVDWNDLAAKCKLSADKVSQWWMRASSDIVHHG
jgi:hypothetical protein